MLREWFVCYGIECKMRVCEEDIVCYGEEEKRKKNINRSGGCEAPANMLCELLTLKYICP